ncbi:MAG: hypothetical protein ABI405_02505, partial [Parafilimonas sp.]
MKSFHLYKICFVIISLLITQFCNAQTMMPLYQNKKFALYADSVVQDNYTAKVLSHTALASNYQSAANLFKS